MENQQTEIERLVEMYRLGASDVEVCAELKMPFREFEKRINTDDNFAKLVEFGRTAARAWWMRISRENLKEKTFNATIWKSHMANRYGWADTRTENTEVSKPMEQMSNDELEIQALKFLKGNKTGLAAMLKHKNVEVEEDADGSSKVH